MTEDEAAFETRFASLEDASRNLSADVSALNTTLTVVNDLQIQQRETKRRQDEAERLLNVAKAAAEAREKRISNSVRAVGWSLTILLPLVSLLVYVSLLVHVNSLLEQQQRDRYKNCLVRNTGTMANVQRETALARLETDPQIAKLHTDSAASLAKSVVDCSTYRVKP